MKAEPLKREDILNQDSYIEDDFKAVFVDDVLSAVKWALWGIDECTDTKGLISAKKAKRIIDGAFVGLRE